MRILLFDPSAGGHHEVYLRRFADCLEADELIIAAPASSCIDLHRPSVQTYVLGESVASPSTTLGRLREGAHQWQVFRQTAQSVSPELVIHLYADRVLPNLALGSMPGPQILAVLFYPRSHYPRQFGTRLSVVSRGKGLTYDTLLRMFRRRRSCHGVMFLDEFAACIQGRRLGAPAHWLPEPPVAKIAAVPSTRSGCIVYGALSPIKGIDLLVKAAIYDRREPLDLLLCGSVSDENFREQLQRWSVAIRSAGSSVELRLWRHSESEGLEALASASCALIPYREHNGMSRTLVEAASVGTPVIVNQYGLLGHLVREHALGKAVDLTNPLALAGAIAELSTPQGRRPYIPHLAAFATRYSWPAFRDAVLRGVGRVSARPGSA